MIPLRTVIPLSSFKEETMRYLSLIEVKDEDLMLTLHAQITVVVLSLNSFI